MRALATNATIQTATLQDDGLEVTTTWGDTARLAGTLTPISLEQVARLSLQPSEATHTLVTGNGLSIGAGSHRAVIGARVYDVVRVTNLPSRTVIVLREGPVSEHAGS
jgi:hypothetical protein